MQASGSTPSDTRPLKILLFANTEWYLYNFRRSLATELVQRGHDVLLLSPPGAYGAKLRDLGFRWIPAPMQRLSLNPLRELALVLWLARLIRSERIDVVHGFTIKCAIYASLAARFASLRRAPARVSAVAGMGYVFTSRDITARVLRPFVRGLFRLALGGRGARVILQNPDDVALFRQARLVAPELIHLIPGSGVDSTRFTPRAATAGAAAPVRVLLPARLLWDKGLGEFIEAARMLRGDARPLEFLLAGEPDAGNPASVSIDTVRAWVDEGLVQWLGHVQDMPALFRSVDIVALPSYREGLPKGLIEAAACGVALITTDVPGCREVVSDGVNGLLVPVRSADALAAAIWRLASNAGLRQRLGEAARADALARYDERIIIRMTMDVYRELVQAL